MGAPSGGGPYYVPAYACQPQINHPQLRQCHLEAARVQEQFGEKARFLLCSEAPQPSIRDVFGLGSLLGGGSAGGGQLVGSSGSDGGGGRLQGVMHRLAAAAGGGAVGEEAAYAACRSAIEAALDEAEQRAHWERFRVHV